MGIARTIHGDVMYIKPTIWYVGISENGAKAHNTSNNEDANNLFCLGYKNGDILPIW